MIREAEARQASWQLVYGGRTRTSMTFSAELQALAQDRMFTYPQDELGLIDLDRYLRTPVPETLIYACGPEALLDAVEQRTAHWPAARYTSNVSVLRPSASR